MFKKFVYYYQHEAINFLNFLRVLSKIFNYPFVGPYKVIIDITNKCDMGCIMCQYQQEIGSIQHFKIKQFSQLLEDLKKIHTERIVLCGEGEPLLHPEFESLLYQLDRNKFGVELFSNGLYFTPEMQKRIFKFKNIKKMLISFPATNENDFIKIRPGRSKEDFYRIIENLNYFVKSYKKKKILFYLIFVLMKQNYNNLPEILKLAQKLKVDRVILKPGIPFLGLKTDIVVGAEDLKKLLKLQTTIKKIKIDNNLKEVICFYKYVYNKGKYHYKKWSCRNCLIPWVYSAITLSGDVIVCPYLSPRRSIGNVFQESFINIWKKRDIAELDYFTKRCLMKKVIYKYL